MRGLPAHLRVDTAVVSTPERQLSLFRSMRRTFAPYQQWEDYRAGMFSGRWSETFVIQAEGVLGSPKCQPAMWEAVTAWPVCSAVNLTNTESNRRAWLGQAACCFAVQATAVETRRAWWQLSDGQRRTANACADEVIAQWYSDQD